MPDILAEIHFVHTRDTKATHRYDLPEGKEPAANAPFLKSFYLPLGITGTDAADNPNPPYASIIVQVRAE